jgi:hypothetical protein
MGKKVVAMGQVLWYFLMSLFLLQVRNPLRKRHYTMALDASEFLTCIIIHTQVLPYQCKLYNKAILQTKYSPKVPLDFFHKISLSL